jgi:hypothetical protein
MQESIKLDGRTFTSISQALTANQDDYIYVQLRLAGAVEVLTDQDGKTRTQEQRAEDLLTILLASGRNFHVLAGCLTEEGRAWSRAEADRNAARFSGITDMAEKAEMRTSIVRFVIGFFSLGEASSKTSPKSSTPTGKGPRTKSAALKT